MIPRPNRLRKAAKRRVLGKECKAVSGPTYVQASKSEAFELSCGFKVAIPRGSKTLREVVDRLVELHDAWHARCGASPFVRGLARRRKALRVRSHSDLVAGDQALDRVRARARDAAEPV